MSDFPSISVIIPAHNSAGTLEACLGAVLACKYPDFEVVVIDDNSTDLTAQIIAQHSDVKQITLDRHSGASRARNMGAGQAKGDILFFIDSDCIVMPNTLKLAAEAYKDNPGHITGGTYTPIPPEEDRGFYSTFQSIFIHYNETKLSTPDYVATHAMIIGRQVFTHSGGFMEQSVFMPILEDVEFSHRMRESGVGLIMRPDIQVGHVFNFTLLRSLTNAFKKARHWTAYSRARGEMLSDSGTASIGLKTMAACTALSIALFALGLAKQSILLLLLPPLPIFLGLAINASIIEAFFKHGGPVFAMRAVPYYCTLYPMAAALGGLAGLIGSMIASTDRRRDV